jgi:hypothetical protein
MCISLLDFFLEPARAASKLCGSAPDQRKNHSSGLVYVFLFLSYCSHVLRTATFAVSRKWVRHRAETKLFVFVFSREKKISLFAKKLTKMFVFAKVFAKILHLKFVSGFRSHLNVYPDLKHWLKFSQVSRKRNFSKSK